MKKLVLGLLALGFTTQFMYSQIEELPTVRLDVNYKYLDATSNDELALPVRNLEKEVAFYNLKQSAFYTDGFDTYEVSFVIPQGKILAEFDSESQILRTVERFKNIELPRSIVEAIAEQYPNWIIAEDFYRVDYFGHNGVAKKQYKVKLKNGDDSKTLKFDGNGKFL